MSAALFLSRGTLVPLLSVRLADTRITSRQSTERTPHISGLPVPFCVLKCALERRPCALKHANHRFCVPMFAHSSFRRALKHANATRPMTLPTFRRISTAKKRMMPGGPESQEPPGIIRKTARRSNHADRPIARADVTRRRGNRSGSWSANSSTTQPCRRCRARPSSRVHARPWRSRRSRRRCRRGDAA